MRFFVSLVLALAVVLAGWLVYRSVSVESTDEKVQITIDKRQLKEAGHDLEDTGREAVDKVGEALQRAGKKRGDAND